MYGLITNRTVNNSGWISERNPEGNTFWLCPELPIANFPAWKIEEQPDFRYQIASTGKHPLLFVHGFNNTPEKALATMQALAEGLGDGFTYVSYLWPSKGQVDLIGYDEDRHSAQNFSGDLLAAIKLLGKPHVIAHSMGNWMLECALQWAWLKSADKLVSAYAAIAADVDNDVFSQKDGQGLAQLVERGQIYYSHTDGALAASVRVHLGKSRLGLTGAEGGCPGQYTEVNATPPKGPNLIELHPVEPWENHGAYFQSPQVYSLLKQFFQAKAQGAAA